MKKLAILFILFGFIQVGVAQKPKIDKANLDYLVYEIRDVKFNVDYDTVYCIITDFYRSNESIRRIKYIDLKEKLHVLKDNNEIETIKTFRAGQYTLDYIPLKANKPNSYHAHIERKNIGAMIIYDHIGLAAYTDKNGDRTFYYAPGMRGEAKYAIKFPDGTFFDINKKNIEKHIAPYMKMCNAFNRAFDFIITIENVEEAVGVYNSLFSHKCK